MLVEQNVSDYLGAGPRVSVPRCIIGARNPRGQEDSKVILTDAAITNALNQTVQKIREGDLEQAQAALTVLEFHRLMRPMKDSIKGPRQFLSLIHI